MSIHGHGTGFTALEMMVTLSIAAILLLTGIPALEQFSMQQQLKAAISALQNDLMMARSEAVYLNARVVSCPGTPQAGCADSSDWSAGWIVFVDDNADRQRQADERLVRHGQGFGNLLIMSSTGRRDIRFFPDGTAPGSNGSITFCGLAGPPQARRLVISNLGRIRRDPYPGIDPSNCPT